MGLCFFFFFCWNPLPVAAANKLDKIWNMPSRARTLELLWCVQYYHAHDILQ